MQTQLPATVDPDKFGSLIEIPKILDANKTSLANAQKAASAVLTPVRSLDLTKVPLEVMEAHDAKLNDLYVKLNTTATTIKAKRDPYTQFFDEIRSLFTDVEGKINTLKSDVKSIRDAWAREKLQRERNRQAELQKETDKRNEAVDIMTSLQRALNIAIVNNRSAIVTKMNEAFNQQTVDSFPEYERKLRGYQPTIGGEWLNKLFEPPYTISVRFHTEDEIKAIAEGFKPKIVEAFTQLHTDPIVKERDRLIELIPSRKMELERIANDAAAKAESDKRIAAEQKERDDAAALQLTQQQEQATAQAETTKLTELFDVHSSAEPVIEKSKGTVVKKKYVATSHAGHIAIMQWWTKNVLPGMTVEELNTKLSFMRTSATKALNEGEKIEAPGLIVEDDVSTRGSKTKAE